MGLVTSEDVGCFVMKIPSSFSYLMRAVVAPKIGLIRNLSPSIEGHLMHTLARETERRLLGLYLGTKNVAGCIYDPALKILVPLWPPLYKDNRDTFSIAKQLKEQIDQYGVCKVVVGRWPWSLKEEQGEYDLILGAAKVECFMDDLLNTGILKDVKHLYYDARIVLNESGIKRRLRELKLQGIKNFTGEETKLLEDLCDAYASQFMLMHYFELAGDGAFNGSNTRECNIPADIPKSERNSIITVERNKAVLTYALCGAGYLGKVFPDRS